MLRTVAHLFLLVSSISLCMAQGGKFVHWRTLSCVRKHSILARSVFVMHGHRLFRDIAVVLTASIYLIFYYISSETGNWRSSELRIRCVPYQERGRSSSSSSSVSGLLGWGFSNWSGEVPESVPVPVPGWGFITGPELQRFQGQFLFRFHQGS